MKDVISGSEKFDTEIFSREETRIDFGGSGDGPDQIKKLIGALDINTVKQGIQHELKDWGFPPESWEQINDGVLGEWQQNIQNTTAEIANA